MITALKTSQTNRPNIGNKDSLDKFSRLDYVYRIVTCHGESINLA